MCSLYVAFVIVGCPTYLSADLGFTAILSSSIYLFRPLPQARWAELNQNRPHARNWVRFENAFLKCGYPLPIQIGNQKPLFSTTSQLNFNGLYLRIETRYRQSASALATTKGVLRRLKTTWTLVHKRLKIGPAFLPTGLYVNSASHFIARLRRRRSANGTQLNFAKR